jgi:protein BUR2
MIIDEQSKEYWRWRDNILLYEELMLEYLTFDVVIQSPYNFLYGFLQRLHIDDNKQIRNVAWAYLNDSCLTMLCLLMSPKDIAIGALYFAAKFTGEKIPDDEHGEPWWTQLGGKPDLIVKAVAVIYEFYNENPLKRNENPYAQSPSSVANEDDLDGTRMRTFHCSLATPSPEGTQRSQRSQNGNADQDSGHAFRKSETPAERKQGDGAGSSDAALKEAANDPATHEGNSHSNGVAGLVPGSTEGVSRTLNPSPKRKANDASEPAAKKPRVDSAEPEGSVDSAESEDGELKE